MFKKLINWWNKPWTNGTCIKWGLNSMLFSIAFGLIWLLGFGFVEHHSKK